MAPTVEIICHTSQLWNVVKITGPYCRDLVSLPFRNCMPHIAIMKFCQNHWPPPNRRDLVSSPFQNFVPHIEIIKFFKNYWSPMRSGVIALPKFYATHGNYEILSKSLAPTVEIWCHCPSKVLCHTSKLRNFVKITSPYCRDLVSLPYQNFMPHIEILKFCQNHWSLL
jgi:hypothetical protein